MDAFSTALLNVPRWQITGAIVWPRADFKCEYCDTSLVDDHGTYRWGYSYDHILPASKYRLVIKESGTWIKNTATDYRNIALACCFCNEFKGKFDVGEGFVPHDTTDISHDKRIELIARVRAFLGNRGRSAWANLREEYRLLCEVISQKSDPQRASGTFSRL